METRVAGSPLAASALVLDEAGVPALVWEALWVFVMAMNVRGA